MSPDIKFLEFGTTTVAIAPIEAAAGETRREAERRTALMLMRKLTRLSRAYIAHYRWGEPCIAQKPLLPWGKVRFRKDIGISISHSRRLAAVAIDYTRPIGIDIEEPRAQLFNVASRFLSVDERSLLGFQSVECDTRPGSFTIFYDPDAHSRTDLLYQLTRAWTIKEAMVKLCGGHDVDLRADLRALPSPTLRGIQCTLIADLTLLGHHLALLTTESQPEEKDHGQSNRQPDQQE